MANSEFLSYLVFKLWLASVQNSVLMITRVKGAECATISIKYLARASKISTMRSYLPSGLRES